MPTASRKPAVAPVEDVADAAPAEREPETQRCPHDGAEMVQHGPGNPAKEGAWHCSDCGCCMRDGELREGHSGCPAAMGVKA